MKESSDRDADSDAREALELLSQSSVLGLSGGVGENSLSSGDIGSDRLLGPLKLRCTELIGFVDD